MEMCNPKVMAEKFRSELILWYDPQFDVKTKQEKLEKNVGVEENCYNKLYDNYEGEPYLDRGR